MSLSSEITRLQNAKSALKTSIEAKGVPVSDSTLISDYSAYVDQIPTGGGGGGGNEDLIDLIERDITTLNIPSGTTKIGNYAFSGCSSLTSVTIPNSVTSIGDSTFQNCRSLTNIVIPNSVSKIGTYTFRGCTGLTSITIQATTPPTLKSINAFSNTNNCPIYVPAESVNTYKTATNWNKLSNRISAIVA